MQEIGYTDTIIDVRSNRVRSLLGLNNNTDTEEMNTPALNGNESIKNKQEYNDEGLFRRGKQQHPPKKVEINMFIFFFNLKETQILSANCNIIEFHISK